jgi:hypothetical protein
MQAAPRAATTGMFAIAPIAEQVALRIGHIGVSIAIRQHAPLRARHPQRKPPIGGSHLSSHRFLLSHPCPAKRGRGHRRPPAAVTLRARRGASLWRQRGGRGVGLTADLRAARPLHHPSGGPPPPAPFHCAGADALSSLPAQRSNPFFSCTLSPPSNPLARNVACRRYARERAIVGKLRASRPGLLRRYRSSQ